MKHLELRRLIFLALCCDLGLFSKRLVAPVANLLTDALHIPGGIGTSFSLMFLVVAAVICGRFGSGTLMGAAQSVLALAFGMTGSMGALAPIGYILPGLVIDCLLWATKSMALTDRMMLCNALAAMTASLTANAIVFHLGGPALALYLCVAAVSGSLCGRLGAALTSRLMTALALEHHRKEEAIV